MNKHQLLAGAVPTALALLAIFVGSFYATGDYAALNSSLVRTLVLLTLCVDVGATAIALRRMGRPQDREGSNGWKR